jgi:hypothetical protein
MSDAAGFWMSGGVLELRALHLPGPTVDGLHQRTPMVRDRCSLASRGYHTGCVPRNLGEACTSTDAHTLYWLGGRDRPGSAMPVPRRLAIPRPSRP